MSFVRRIVCRVRDHDWAYMAFRWQRRCRRCDVVQFKDLLRGGWVTVPRVLK